MVKNKGSIAYYFFQMNFLDKGKKLYEKEKTSMSPLLLKRRNCCAIIAVLHSSKPVIHPGPQTSLARVKGHC